MRPYQMGQIDLGPPKDHGGENLQDPRFKYGLGGHHRERYAVCYGHCEVLWQIGIKREWWLGWLVKYIAQ